MLDGQRVGSRCEQAVAHSSEDLALDRGGVVCVQYVGTTTSENAEWLLGECPPGSINRGWFPAANMYPRDYTSIKIRWAINGEVLAIVELQTSDTLDALPLVVSTPIGEYTCEWDFSHDCQLLRVAQQQQQQPQRGTGQQKQGRVHGGM